MKLRTMEDVEHALAPYYAVAAEMTGKDITVERVERLLDHIGNPEKELRVVHVAGTSGKTSTTYYVAALLHAAGQKVGHTVSPHIDSLTERVQIDGKPLSERRFCELMGDFLELAASAPETPSWFEIMITFALWVFAREHVDYAVLETGMGGLHDATNVCNRPDKVCLITDIGLDHTEWLGDTVAQIAGQKAGIIHPGNAVFMYEQSPEIMQVVRFKVTQSPDAELYQQNQTTLADIYGGTFLDDMPLYQRRNWLLAYAAYRYLVNRDELPLVGSAALSATQQELVPARMETIVQDAVKVVMDGAHNEAKMMAFVDSFRARYGTRRVPILLALKANKQYDDIVPLLAGIARKVIVTSFAASQDWPVKSVDPFVLADIVTDAGITDVIVEPDMRAAYRQLIAAADDLVVVTGSFYLISQLRASGVLR